MLSFPTKRKRPAPTHGATLRELVSELGVVDRGTCPTFPSILLTSEVKLGKAEESGNRDQIDLAARDLAVAVVEQLTRDHQRLEQLGDHAELEFERAFLRNRVGVLEARLGGLGAAAHDARVTVPAARAQTLAVTSSS